MAGSRRWYVYTDDDGDDWGVELDEDTGSLSGLGFTAVTTSTELNTLPRGVTMRTLNAVQTSGDGAGYRYRKFPVGTEEATLFAGTTSTFTVNGLNYTVTSTRGEKKRKPYGSNTGLVGSSPTVGGGE